MPTQIGGRTWSNTDLILGGGLVVALINWFIPWWWTFSFTYTGITGVAGLSDSGGASGFSDGWGILGFIVLLALIALFAVRVFAPNVLPPLPVADWTLYAGGGAFLVLMAVLFLTYAGGANDSGPGYHEGISIGFFLGLLTAVVVAVGGYMKKSEPQPATQPFNLSSMGQSPPPPSYGPPPPPPAG